MYIQEQIFLIVWLDLLIQFDNEQLRVLQVACKTQNKLLGSPLFLGNIFI